MEERWVADAYSVRLNGKALQGENDLQSQHLLFEDLRGFFVASLFHLVEVGSQLAILLGPSGFGCTGTNK